MTYTPRTEPQGTNSASFHKWEDDQIAAEKHEIERTIIYRQDIEATARGLALLPANVLEATIEAAADEITQDRDDFHWVLSTLKDWVADEKRSHVQEAA